MTVDDVNANIRKLLNRIMAIEADAGNRNVSGSFYTYKPAVRKRLDKLRWEITHLLSERRALQGNPVRADAV